MHQELSIARSEFILGGQKSGKSRRAEILAQQWLDLSTQHGAVLIATAQPWDEEMRVRIARHQADRVQRVPHMQTIEEPLALAQTLADHSRPDVLLVVDCLTLWLTNGMMSMHPQAGAEFDVDSQVSALTESIAVATGPVVLVGNEIGMGVIPMGAEVRAFVDALGRLNQRVAQACARVTWMAAGLPLTLKAAP
ncbi:MAG: bifunctional adenosylcobinamide kinase/adenosylcobinamide-phosphate guanylyltransferase [Cytophagales bacterium]|nr:bifunctional adenosylcobinamide kinase/adenosylcobinamide-phosphate guanylyltransferase [Cytophagales bacterium]